MKLILKFLNSQLFPVVTIIIFFIVMLFILPLKCNAQGSPPAKPLTRADIFRWFDHNYLDSTGTGDSIIVLMADSASKALQDASGNTITSTYETITNVGKIGDDTASYKIAYDSSQHDYLRSNEEAVDVDTTGTKIAAALANRLTQGATWTADQNANGYTLNNANISVTSASNFSIYGDAKVSGQYLEKNYIRGLDTSSIYAHLRDGEQWIRGLNSYALYNNASDTTGSESWGNVIDSVRFFQGIHFSPVYIPWGHGPQVGDSIYDDMIIKKYFLSGTGYNDSLDLQTSPVQADFTAEWDSSLTAYNDGVDGKDIFDAQYDGIIIGAASPYIGWNIDLSSGGTGTVTPIYQYCSTGTHWTTFSPDFDNTNGWFNDGRVIWDLDNLPGWASLDPGGAETNTGYYIRVVRTRSTASGTHTVSNLDIYHPYDSINWNDNLLASDNGCAVIEDALSPYLGLHTPLPEGSDYAEDNTFRKNETGNDEDWEKLCAKCTTTVSSVFDTVIICIPDPLISPADLNYSSGDTTFDFSGTHSADAFLFIDAENRLYAIGYCPDVATEVLGTPITDRVFIYAIESNNGLNWDKSNVIYLYHTDQVNGLSIVSPSLTIGHDNKIEMWANSGLAGRGNRLYKFVADSMHATFTISDTVTFNEQFGYDGWGTAVDTGIWWWHGTVTRRGSEYDIFTYFSDSNTSGLSHERAGIYYGLMPDGEHIYWHTEPILSDLTADNSDQMESGLYIPRVLWKDEGRGGHYKMYYSARGAGGSNLSWHTYSTNVYFNNYGYVPILPISIAGAGSAGPGDSTRLEISSHDGKAICLFRDSSIAGGAGPQTDSVWALFQMPHWADIIDSIAVTIKGKSATADSAELSKIEIFGYDRSSSGVVPDSSYWSNTTARNTTSAVRYAYYVDNRDILPGENFSLLLEHTLGANVNGVIYYYNITAYVSEF